MVLPLGMPRSMSASPGPGLTHAIDMPCVKMIALHATVWPLAAVCALEWELRYDGGDFWRSPKLVTACVSYTQQLRGCLSKCLARCWRTRCARIVSAACTLQRPNMHVASSDMLPIACKRQADATARYYLSSAQSVRPVQPA